MRALIAEVAIDRLVMMALSGLVRHDRLAGVSQVHDSDPPAPQAERKFIKTERRLLALVVVWQKTYSRGKHTRTLAL